MAAIAIDGYFEFKKKSLIDEKGHFILKDSAKQGSPAANVVHKDGMQYNEYIQKGSRFFA
ncbi:MAG: hypothetical protein AUJ72_01110 [Candidatus Omnitrophica bacterium CG1_02_46_14]|nr:MAG: hypothetical protein AUJ72_01110 [Candidatus Omnitrophica bacterium CG1_02_46_14]